MDEIKRAATRAITVRVPEPLHREARLLSVRRNESLNALIIKWLQAWVDHHKEEA